MPFASLERFVLALLLMINAPPSCDSKATRDLTERLSLLGAAARQAAVGDNLRAASALKRPLD